MRRGFAGTLVGAILGGGPALRGPDAGETTEKYRGKRFHWTKDTEGARKRALARAEAKRERRRARNLRRES